MEKMYQTYNDIAEFYIVYIAEAHAADDRWPVGYAKDNDIREHTNYGERCDVARRLVEEKSLTIPCLIDDMSNGATKDYLALPDRIYLVDSRGRIAIAGKRGPWGFVPALKRAEKWLAAFRETGDEPQLGAFADDVEEDAGELRAEMFAAYRKGDYEKALEISLILHEIDPESEDTLYNIACMHCKLGHVEQAYEWLEKAIDAGYVGADHIAADADFESIRNEPRFLELVELARKSEADQLAAVDMVAFQRLVGDWEMNTEMGGQSVAAVMTLSIEDGKPAGTWQSMGRSMKLAKLKLRNDSLEFDRRFGPDQSMSFTGTVNGKQIVGKHDSPFGEFTCTGTRKEK
jgi:tetratricopeptide (TPR) repeat protein